MRLSEVGDEILPPLKAMVSAPIETAQQGLHSSSCFTAYNEHPGITVTLNKLSPCTEEELVVVWYISNKRCKSLTQKRGKVPIPGFGTDRSRLSPWFYRPGFRRNPWTEESTHISPWRVTVQVLLSSCNSRTNNMQIATLKTLFGYVFSFPPKGTAQ